jgi:hypothetical protein
VVGVEVGVEVEVVVGVEVEVVVEVEVGVEVGVVVEVEVGVEVGVVVEVEVAIGYLWLTQAKPRDQTSSGNWSMRRGLSDLMQSERGVATGRLLESRRRLTSKCKECASRPNVVRDCPGS